MISCVKQSKTNVTHLWRRNKTTLALTAGLPAPWVLSGAGKLILYLHRSYFLPYHNTVSTPDATKCYRTGCSAASRQIPDNKLLLRSIYDIILTLIFNTRFIVSSVDTPYFVPQMLSSFVVYPPSLSFCRSARLMSVMCTDERSLLCIMIRHAPYCWLAIRLFWYSARLVF